MTALDNINPIIDRMQGPSADNPVDIPFGNADDLQTGQPGNNPGFTGGPEDLLYYFRLQVQVARETLFFQTISNVVKARQDAALNSVRNVRN